MINFQMYAALGRRELLAHFISHTYVLEVIQQTCKSVGFQDKSLSPRRNANSVYILCILGKGSYS